MDPHPGLCLLGWGSSHFIILQHWLVSVGYDSDDSSHSGHRMLQKQALVCFPNRHDSALYLNFLKNSCLLLIGQCGQVLLEF